MEIQLCSALFSHRKPLFESWHTALFCLIKTISKKFIFRFKEGGGVESGKEERGETGKRGREGGSARMSMPERSKAFLITDDRTIYTTWDVDL